MPVSAIFKNSVYVAIFPNKLVRQSQKWARLACLPVSLHFWLGFSKVLCYSCSLILIFLSYLFCRTIFIGNRSSIFRKKQLVSLSGSDHLHFPVESKLVEKNAKFTLVSSYDIDSLRYVGHSSQIQLLLLTLDFNL